MPSSLAALPPSGNVNRPELGHPNGVQLGGLGTGRIELMRTGRPGVVALLNSPQRIVGPWRGTFFSLRAGDDFRLLQLGDQGGARGVDAVDYQGRHPIADCRYTVADWPLSITLTAFAPMVPHDLHRSTQPGVVFSFRLRNLSGRAMPIELGFSWENVLGVGATGYRGENLVARRDGAAITPLTLPDDVAALRCTLPFPSDAIALNRWGETLLATTPPPGFTCACWPFWNVLADEHALLAALAAGALSSRFDAGMIDACAAAVTDRQQRPPTWDDPDPRFGGGRAGVEGMVHPAGVLAVRGELAPDQEVEIPFVLAWHAPHHVTNDGHDHGRFASLHGNAATVAMRLLARRAADLRDTRALAAHLEAGDLPPWLVDKLCNDTTPLAANSIITADGTLYTLESTPMMWGAVGTLDQRLVSHPGTSLFYPDLDRTELDAFARLQADDGRMMHFAGNAHEALGSGKVVYGDSGWPDLAMSYIIQVWRSWTATGDASFHAAHWPHVERAAAWLMARDHDGDGVPEGGSSWDVEHYPGCFIATATLWMATLRVLREAAVHLDLNDRVPDLDARFARAAATVQRMWNGTHYRKYLTADGTGSDDCFIGQLEGEWVARELALEPVLPLEQATRAALTCYRLNADPRRYQLAPIQVRADGRLADRKYAWHAWPQYTMTFLDCAALYLGLDQPAMENIARFDRVVRHTIRAPWATTLWHDARTGLPDFRFYGLDWYMNGPAIWWVLQALTGINDNALTGRLALGPRLPAGRTCVTYPVVCPRWWGHVSLRQEASQLRLTLSVDRLHRGDHLALRCFRWRGALAAAHLEHPHLPPPACRAVGPYTDIELASPLILRQGDHVELLLNPVAAGSPSSPGPAGA